MNENETTEENNTAKNVTFILTLAFGVGALAGAGHALGSECGQKVIAKAKKFRETRTAKKNPKKTEN